MRAACRAIAAQTSRVRTERASPGRGGAARRRSARASARRALGARPLRALAFVLCAGVHGALAATPSAGGAEALYAEALRQIETERYADALAGLRRLQRDFPAFERMPAVQTRVAVLQEARAGGPAVAAFLDALAHRDGGDAVAASARLAALVEAYPDSTLVDDALYLQAYFSLMDRYAFAEARERLLELGRRFPDTAYRESAIYLDAIALEQLGQTESARVALRALRDRHTAVTLPFDYRWPAGGVMARYWFDRADRRLGMLDRRLREASTLRAREEAPSGALKLDVSVGGRDMTLLLVPSPLVRGTAWLDAALSDRAPPAIGVYEGRVQGSADSWVRAVVRADSITGLVQVDGERYRLLPANLVGTLDYYLPEPEPAGGDGSSLAEILRDRDALAPPPALGGASPALATTAPEERSDVRAVPLSVVIDSRFDRYHAGEGLAAALNDLNIADGIYRDFDLALSLDEVLVFDEARDPMALGPVTLETLLRRFRGYRLERDTLFSGSALTYLFSGNPKTDVTLGLAWIDTLCRRDGYDVGVITPSAFGDVLLTHELGHSLGAQHDTDTACSAERGYLMWPNISARTPTALSSCSESSVRRAHARSCLLDTVDLSLSALEEGESVRFVAENPDGSLAVDATLILETGAARDVSGWPEGCVAQAPTAARCALAELGPGERRDVVLGLAEGDGATAELVASGVAELSPENNVASGGGALATASLGAPGSGELAVGSGVPRGEGRGEGASPGSGVAIGGAGDSGGTGASGALALLVLLLVRFGRPPGGRRDDRLSARSGRPAADARRA